MGFILLHRFSPFIPLGGNGAVVQDYFRTSHRPAAAQAVRASINCGNGGDDVYNDLRLHPRDADALRLYLRPRDGLRLSGLYVPDDRPRGTALCDAPRRPLRPAIFQSVLHYADHYGIPHPARGRRGWSLPPALRRGIPRRGGSRTAESAGIPYKSIKNEVPKLLELHFLS